MFANTKSVHKFQAIKKRALRFMLNDYKNSNEDLSKRLEKSNMNLQRTITLCTEVSKLSTI